MPEFERLKALATHSRIIGRSLLNDMLSAQVVSSRRLMDYEVKPVMRGARASPRGFGSHSQPAGMNIQMEVDK